MTRSSSLPTLLVRSMWLLLSRRVHFPRDRIGDPVLGEGENYRVFRQMVVEPPADGAVLPGALLDVRFRFKRFSPAVNRRLSRLPIPFIAAQPGFLSKTWMVGEDSGAYRGLYEWATVEHADAYWDSYPMRMMKRRAAGGTLETSIASIHPTGAE